MHAHAKPHSLYKKSPSRLRHPSILHPPTTREQKRIYIYMYPAEPGVSSHPSPCHTMPCPERPMLIRTPSSAEKSWPPQVAESRTGLKPKSTPKPTQNEIPLRTSRPKNQKPALQHRPPFPPVPVPPRPAQQAAQSSAVAAAAAARRCSRPRSATHAAARSGPPYCAAHRGSQH